MPTDGKGVLRGKPGFFLDKIGTEEDVRAALAMGTDTLEGRALVQGWTPLPMRGLTLEMYCLAEVPEACRHDMLHLLYYLVRSAELCTYETPEGFRTVYVYVYVEHGGPCDPFVGGGNP